MFRYIFITISRIFRNSENTAFKNKKALVSLGTGESSVGHTFSAKNIPGYENLTADDFDVRVTSIGISACSDGPDTYAGYISKSYNKTTGELSVSSAYTKAYGAYWKSWVISCVGYTVYVIQ